MQNSVKLKRTFRIQIQPEIATRVEKLCHNTASPKSAGSGPLTAGFQDPIEHH
jgi:hypothetical protein